MPDNEIAQLGGEAENDRNAYGEIWRRLYTTLTTSQIETALRSAGKTWEDWRKFLDHMKTYRD